MADGRGATRTSSKVLEAYRMFANSKGLVASDVREDIGPVCPPRRLSEKEQSLARARMGKPATAYLRERLPNLG